MLPETDVRLTTNKAHQAARLALARRWEATLKYGHRQSMTETLTLTLSFASRRRAQLKYREKQRQQREDDRRTIEELSARVEALETERAELSRRNQLLTSVAAIKEAQSPAQPEAVNVVVGSVSRHPSAVGNRSGRAGGCQCCGGSGRHFPPLAGGQPDCMIVEAQLGGAWPGSGCDMSHARDRQRMAAIRFP